MMRLYYSISNSFCQIWCKVLSLPCPFTSDDFYTIKEINVSLWHKLRPLCDLSSRPPVTSNPIFALRDPRMLQHPVPSQLLSLQVTEIKMRIAQIRPQVTNFHVIRIRSNAIWHTKVKGQNLQKEWVTEENYPLDIGHFDLHLSNL